MRWVAILAIIAFGGFIALFIYSNPQTEVDEINEQEEEVPMLMAEMVQTEIVQAQDVGATLSWILIAFAVFMQLIAWIAAAQKLGAVKKSAQSIDERFSHLDAIEVYFDLPLYFGLLGTVLAFIVITLYPQAGLMFAYVSTGIGIIVSVILRLFYLTPYRQELIGRKQGIGG